MNVQLTPQQIRAAYPFMRCAGLPHGWLPVMEMLGFNLMLTLGEQACGSLVLHLRCGEEGQLAATAMYDGNAGAEAVAAVRALCDEFAETCAATCTECGRGGAATRWTGWRLQLLCGPCADRFGLVTPSDRFRDYALALALEQPGCIPDLIARAHALDLPDAADIAATLADMAAPIGMDGTRR